MENYELITLIKLSLQRALIGSVSKNLIAVTGGIRDKTIYIHAFLEGEISTADKELIQSIGTEVLSDFPPEFRVEEHCFSVEEHPLEVLDFWVFMRQQSS